MARVVKRHERSLFGNHLSQGQISCRLSLPAAPGTRKSQKNFQSRRGVLVDYNKAGNPIGLEITAPKQVARETIKQVFADLNLPPITEKELAPLRAV